MSDWVSDIKRKDIVGSEINGRILLRYVLKEGREEVSM